MSDFNLLLGTKIDTSDLQAKLKAIPESQRTITVAIKGDTTQIKTLYKEGNTLYQTLEKIDKTGTSTGETLTKMTKKAETVSTGMEKASKSSATFLTKIVDITKKVLAFGAVTSAIGLFTKSIGDAVETVKELDDSLVGLRKVSDLSSEGLKAYTQDAFNLAKQLSTTASNVTDATTAFIQAGYSLGDSETMAKYAVMLQTIADKTMDIEDSTSFMTSTLKAFNMTANDSEKVISSINEISNAYAITSNDLTDNLGKVASVAGVAGVSFDQLLGLMTASVTVTRNASKSANAFKSIFINLQQMDKNGTLPKLQKGFEEFGISMTDSNGAIKNAYDLLQELSVAYKEVSKSTDVDKQNKMRTLLEDIGGKYNYNVLVASLTQFNTAIDATNTSLNSTGSAQREFDKSLDSISKKAEAVKGAFQELIWGDGGLDEFIKLILSGTTGILKFATDTNLVKVAIADLSVVLAYMAIKSFAPLLVGLSTSAIRFLTLSSNVYTANMAMEAFNITAISTEAVLGGILAVVSLAYMAWNKYQSSQEQAVETAKKSLSDLKTYNDTAKTTLKSITDETASRETLKNAIDSLGGSYDKEGDAVKSINGLRQEAIDLLYKEAQAKAQQTVRDTGSEYQTSKSMLSSSYSADAGTRKMDFATPAKALSYFNEKIDDYNEKISKGEKLTWAEQSALKYYEEQQAKVSKKVTDAKDVIEGYEGAQKTLNQTEDQWVNTQKESEDATTGYTESTDEATDSTDDLATALKDAQSAYQDAVSSVGDMSDSYATLNDAVNEYNSTGSYSADTLDKLLGLGGDYLSLLDEQDGKVTVNANSAEALANSKIDEAEAMAYAQAMAELNANAQSDLADATNEASDASNSSVTANNNATIGIENAITACNNGTIAWNTYWSAQSNGAVSQGKATQEQAKKIGDALQSQLALLESARKNIGTYTKATGASTSATKSNTSATKSNTDALKAQQDALKQTQDAFKDQVDTYNDVIDYVLDKLETKISKVESKRDSALNAILKSAQKVAGVYKEETNAVEDVMNDLTETYTDKIDDLNSQLEDLTKTHESTLEDLQSQITSIQKEMAQQNYDEVNDYYQKLLDNLDNTNDKLNKQVSLEEKLQAIAKAQATKKMVFKEGVGFVYESDESAVTSAKEDYYSLLQEQQIANQRNAITEEREQKLAELQAIIDSFTKSSKASLAEQLADLQSQVTTENSTYAQKVANLQATTASVNAEYNRQVAQLQVLNSQYEATTTKYTTQISKLTELKTSLTTLKSTYDEMTTGVTANNILLGKSWTDTANNFSTFASNYKTALQNLKNAQDNYNASLKQTATLQSQTGGGTGGGTATASARHYKVVVNTNPPTTIKDGFNSNAEALAWMRANSASTYKYSRAGYTASVASYASGVASIGDNQVAVVGENPNKEIVLGAKANGTPLNMSKGSGVVNAKSTSTIAGILNSIGSSLSGKTNEVVADKSTNNTESVVIQNLNLPNVTNPSQFESWALNLGLLQSAYSNA